MNAQQIEEFEIGAIRPPSEGGSHSLLLRFTRNCPWSRCTFCYGTPYGRGKFELRSVGEIKMDIDRAKAISNMIEEAASQHGRGGGITAAVLDALFLKYPEARYSNSFVNVLNWMNAGAKTVFIQDANSLIMKTADLVEAIRYLKQTFPGIERITSYARSKTVAKKSLENMIAIREAGLSRLHMGLETGDDPLLKKIRKGVSAEEHVEAGRKILEAGIELDHALGDHLGARPEIILRRARRVVGPLTHALDIAAAAEAPARAGHHQDVDVIPALDLIQMRNPADQHFRREGVQRLRPVQGHHRDLVLHLEQQIIRHGAYPSLRQR